MRIIETLITKIPEQLFRKLCRSSFDENPANVEDTLSSIVRFYAQSDDEAYSMDLYKHSSDFIGAMFLPYSLKCTQDIMSSILSRALKDTAPNRDSESALVKSLFTIWSLFATQMQKSFFLKIPTLNEDQASWIHFVMRASYHASDFQLSATCLSILFHCVQQAHVSQKMFELPEFIKAVIDHLWHYLDASHIDKHLTVVNLLWHMQTFAPLLAVDSIMCGYLSSHNSPLKRLQAFNRFGMFWRISENVPESSIAFSRSLFLMVDLLRSKDVALKTAGETFLKCSLKSLSRLLDPVYLILYDLTIQRSVTSIYIHSVNVPVMCYDLKFNQEQICNMLEMLSCIFQYGGTPLVRNLASVRIQNTSVLKILDLHDQIGVGKEFAVALKKPADMTYYDALLRVTVLFLLTENEMADKPMEYYTDRIQCLASEFLQYVIARSGGHLEHADSFKLQSLVIDKIQLCIWKKRPDLQAKLLSLLHTSLPLTFGSLRGDAKHAYNIRTFTAESEESLSRSLKHATQEVETDHSVLRLSALTSLLSLLQNGISSAENVTVLPYYIDFVLSSLPYFRSHFQNFLMLLVKIFCSRVESFCASFLQSRVNTAIDVEGVLLLSGLEKLLVFSFSEAEWEQNQDNFKSPNDSAAYGLRGLTDLVSGVFVGGDSGSDPFSGHQKLCETLCAELPAVMKLLSLIWSACGPKPDDDNEASQDMNLRSPDPFGSLVELVPIGEIMENPSLSSCQNRLRSRIKRVMDHLLRLQPHFIVESVLHCWVRQNPTLLNSFDNVDDSCIHVLMMSHLHSPKIVIKALFDFLKETETGTREKVREFLHISTLKMDDSQVYFLIEHYLDSLIDRDSVAMVFPHVLSHLKESITQTHSNKSIYYSLLRVAVATLRQLPSYVLDDRRVRKEAFDVFQRTLDYCILIAGRSFEIGIFRRSHINSSDALAEPLSSVAQIHNSSENSTVSQSAIVVSPVTRRRNTASKSERATEVLICQITKYLTKLVPNLRQNLPDPDRVANLLTNVVYYVVAPNLKNRFLPVYSRLNDLTMDLLEEISKITSTYKSWRKEIWEAFVDTKFFSMNIETSNQWRAVLRVVMANERDRVDDIIARLNASNNAGIFTSKESEATNKSILLRKLSYLLFCGDKDQFLPQLPSIQEKIVDSLKQPYNILHAEVYMCLRIIFLKISTKHLSNIWPIVITELVRLFQNFTERTSSTAAPVENVAVLTSACKFLDLLFVMAPEEFQM